MAKITTNTLSISPKRKLYDSPRSNWVKTSRWTFSNSYKFNDIMVFAQIRMLWAHPRALKIGMKSLVGTGININVKIFVKLSLLASFDKIELYLYQPSSFRSSWPTNSESCEVSKSSEFYSTWFAYSMLIYSSVASFMYVLECSLPHNCSTATSIFSNSISSDKYSIIAHWYLIFYHTKKYCYFCIKKTVDICSDTFAAESWVNLLHPERSLILFHRNFYMEGNQWENLLAVQCLPVVTRVFIWIDVLLPSLRLEKIRFKMCCLWSICCVLREVYVIQRKTCQISFKTLSYENTSIRIYFLNESVCNGSFILKTHFVFDQKVVWT